MPPTKHIPRDSENGRIAPGIWEVDTKEIKLTGNYAPTVPIPGRIAPGNTPQQGQDPAAHQARTEVVSPAQAPGATILPRSEWPVAVLVVTGGAMKGSVLPVPPGNSTLGRGKENRICMQQDPFVSKQAHLYLTHYADENDKMVLTAGDMGAGVVYLDDSPLPPHASATLTYGARIRLTSKRDNDNPTELMFIPLCGVEGHPFSW